MKKLRIVAIILLVFAGSALMKFGISPHRVAKAVHESTQSKIVEVLDSKLDTQETKDINNEPVQNTTSGVLEPVSQVVMNFKNELTQLFKSLPTKQSVRKEAHLDLHSTPDIIFKAALRIGKVTDQMTQTPELKPTALQFYSDCALQQEGIPAIRAVCLSRARQLSEELGVKNISLKVPTEVEELANL